MAILTVNMAQASQFICNSPNQKDGKAVDVYHIHTTKNYVKHYQYGAGGYALLREITSVKFETSFLETFPGKTMINITKNGYEAYLMKSDNQRDFRFTDSYAGHRGFVCTSKD